MGAVAVDRPRIEAADHDHAGRRGPANALCGDILGISTELPARVFARDSNHARARMTLGDALAMKARAKTRQMHLPTPRRCGRMMRPATTSRVSLRASALLPESMHAL